MKRLAIALATLLVASPAMAGHARRSGDGFEVEPSHCVYDQLFHTWNCWYKPVRPTRQPRRYHHHHHYHHGGPYFRPNKYNEHGVPCYFYKKDGWCF